MPKAGNAIPTRSRELVKARAHFQCERCGGRGAHWHHRRRRGVKDEHQHHPCNGLWMCRSCHDFVHSHNAVGEREGFILRSFTDEPATVPVQTWRGTRYLTCEGSYQESNNRESNDE